MTETIVVTKTNKYGVRVGDKQYNTSKKYSGPAFEEGKTYEADVYTSPSGAKYLNSAKELASNQIPGVSQKQETTTVNTGPTVVVSDEKKEYFRNKDRSQLTGGIFHDSASIVAALVTVQGLSEADAIQAFERVTVALINFRDGLDK